jgi:uncharacterized protein YndB with AHSA1/START domain/uncharacterized protein YciI
VSVSPIRREVVVNVPPETAFLVFTEHIGQWWPLGEHGVFGATATVAFEEDGRLVERSTDGSSDCWGEVVTWDPPSLLSFTWHPEDPAVISMVTVTFSERDERTRVVLEHDGWEAFADPAAARDEYNQGWPAVLDRYAGHVHVDQGADDNNDDTEHGEATWVALMHLPGPDTPSDQSLFGQPGFAEHVAFLHRMDAEGYLVGAGPLADQAGAGMTILRLPGADRLDDAIRLATQDDLSVASGFFTVAVRPWTVMFSRD